MMRVTLKFRIRLAEYRVVKETRGSETEFYVTKHYPMRGNLPKRLDLNGPFETEMGAVYAILRSLETKKGKRK
jgi:hypothetical protein